MPTFENKTIMITGAAGNLGRAVAESFISRGANLVLVDLNADALEQAYPGEDTHLLRCAINLMKPAEIAGAVGAAKERFGNCLLYTSPSPRDLSTSRMPSSA